jgi:phosphomevalonate kinase
MTSVAASAPGKLLLTGEYAVLEGAPAVVAAVDRRVHVHVEAVAPGDGRLTAIPLGVNVEPVHVVDGVLRSRARPEIRLGATARFLPAALAALGNTAAVGSLAITIDSRELFERGSDGAPVKLGLGSSAAVCAALAVALDRLHGLPAADRNPAAALGRWLPVYRRALDSRASGADLAAAFHGGLSAFVDDAGGPVATRLDWPEGLHWQPVWVGRPALTGDFVARFDAWKGTGGAPARACLRDLVAAARTAAGAVHSAEAFVAAAAAYGDAIAALAAAMRVEVISEAHRALLGAAQRLGTTYKTCGAGGGDFGIALDTDRKRVTAFAAAAAECGAVPVHLRVAPQGAASEAVRDASGH